MAPRSYPRYHGVGSAAGQGGQQARDTGRNRPSTGPRKAYRLGATNRRGADRQLVPTVRGCEGRR